MNHDIQTELLIQTIDAIRQCIVRDMSCKHPPSDGSDYPCDGEDCIKCYVLELTNSVLPDERTPDTAPAPEVWRTGPLGTMAQSNVYEGDTWMFQCDTTELAQRIVGLLNGEAKQPDPPPVTAQELRSLVDGMRENIHHQDVCGKCLMLREALIHIRKLADWLERRHE